jgi:hypothetical protein
MPNIVGVYAGDRAERMNTILIAVRPWELDDCKLHRCARMLIYNGSRLYFEPVILDGGIRQEIACDLMKFAFIDSTLELDFDALSHANTSHFVESKMFHCFGRSGALRIEHGTLGHDGNGGFHAVTISCPALAHKPIMIFCARCGERRRWRQWQGNQAKRVLRTLYKRFSLD